MTQLARAAQIVTNVMQTFSRLARLTPEPRMQAPEAGIGPLTRRSRRASEYYRWMDRSSTRIKELEFYDWLCTELPEVERGMDGFATMSVTGNITGLEKGTYRIQLPDNAPEALRERMNQLERLFRQHAFTTVKGMAKYGSYPVELGLVEHGGRLRVGNLIHVPPGTMFRNIDRSGNSASETYWYQQVTDRTQDKVIVPEWRMPHFAIWSNVVTATQTLIYGQSMLRPVGRIGLQVHAVQDAMVIARLTRAAMRMQFDIDVSDIAGDPEKIIARLEEMEEYYSRDREFLGDGAFDSRQRPPIPDSDYFCPKGKTLAYDIKPIEGDTNVGNIKDVEFLMACFFGAIGMPPEYLGHSGQRGGRSVLSQVDVNFARSSRHLQLFAAAGFEHAAIVDMMLGGYDPEKYPPTVVPPPIGARDDLLKAQVRELYSRTLANLTKAGFDPSINPRWVLRTFLGLDEELEVLTDEEMTELFDALPVTAPGGGASGQTTSEAREALHRDPEIKRMLGNLSDIVRLGRQSFAQTMLYHNSVPSVESLRSGMRKLIAGRTVAAAAQIPAPPAASAA